VIVGLILSAVCYGMLPLFGRTLSLALLGLFLIFLTFEFMIVNNLSLTTELLPGSRATMMAGYFAAAGIGRVIGALIGGPIWLAGGVAATGLVSSALSLLALGSLIWALRGWRMD
jgi:predicted MFS family arabinose efflux permease